MEQDTSRRRGKCRHLLLNVLGTISRYGTADTVGLNLVVHANTQHFSSSIPSRKIHMKNMIQRGHLQRRVDAKKTKVTKLRTS